MSDGKLQLDFNTRRIFLDKIISWFAEERDEEIGELAAELILDFFIENFAAEFYNKGVREAREWISGKFGELEEGLEYLYR